MRAKHTGALLISQLAVDTQSRPLRTCRIVTWETDMPTSPMGALSFPGPDPGRAAGRVEGEDLVLENAVLRATWSWAGGSLRLKSIEDRLSGRVLGGERRLPGRVPGGASDDAFRLVLSDTPRPDVRVLGSSRLSLTGRPGVDQSAGWPDFATPTFRFPGVRISARLEWANLWVEWSVSLHDGANYVRQEVSLSGSYMSQGHVEVVEVVPLVLVAPGALVCGEVDGSPVTCGPFFFACEHPSARHRLSDGPEGICECVLPIQRNLPAWRSLSCSAVVGVAPAGQMRRAFLHYLERERAFPYRPFFHYNNGSEAGCEYWKRRLHGQPGEAEAFQARQQAVWLAAIDRFGAELVQARGAVLDCFAHDYAWDDETRVWQFHDGYPRGFAPARRAAERYGAHVGVWLSPWGGYPDQPGKVKAGRLLGFETNGHGLSLAGERYYSRFRNACVTMLRDYDVNYFKFDGFGPGNGQSGPGEFAADIDALLRLLDELRRIGRDVFINVSTGSWPSPFWLLWADCIWRQGNDTSITGKGSDRQKWITYRDREVYRGIVARAPLYPISSLMIHGIFVNRLPLFGDLYDPEAPRPTYEPADIADEVRSFFGTGANLQEMYIDPEILGAETWDVLAECARWARANADVLVDTHWVGGDPGKGAVYGWASWSPRKAILTLRNPDDAPASLSLDAAEIFELPEGAPATYELRSPSKQDADRPGLTLRAGLPVRVELQPFQVLMIEAESNCEPQA